MSIDYQKLNRYLIGPQKRSLTKLINNAKAGCNLTLTNDNSKELVVWAGRWHKAVIYLRIVNSIPVFAKDKDSIEKVITYFRDRAKVGSDDNRDANNFAVFILKEYNNKLKRVKG